MNIHVYWERPEKPIAADVRITSAGEVSQFSREERIEGVTRVVFEASPEASPAYRRLTGFLRENSGSTVVFIDFPLGL